MLGEEVLGADEEDKDDQDVINSNDNKEVKSDISEKLGCELLDKSEKDLDSNEKSNKSEESEATHLEENSTETEGLFTRNTSSTTRGNSMKLVKYRSRLDIRKYYFTNRVVEVWNSLPDIVVTAKNVKIFGNRLDKHWKEHLMIYNFDTEYTYNTGSSTSVVSDDEPEPNIEEQTDLLRLETLR
ncbi:Hypothetical predicted protein [Mytilus galloprovincialis]|uniref:Uncharacterized protein n=1 Tax=Mytilus galloprovincialis TaxID=29158 RepID=A0A8B6GCQ1_MYTGA|nr:Hypothetical predicted protein [Mytilus galloprovincialis]